jgi:NAD(P)-dependent dehydrogenase (short-subunit alcohol dehydrogenase family)
MLDGHRRGGTVEERIVSRYLVSGANRGIGLELCRQLVARGDEVVAVCRRASAQLKALDVRIESGFDAVDEASVAELADRLAGLHLDVLVNNAGILERVGLDDLDVASIRRQFEVNSIGPLRVTRTLLGNLRKGSKVAIVTSLMGSMGDNTSGGSYGYRMSKAAVNAAGVSLAHDLRPRGIAVALLHPGMVNTDMTGGRGIPVEESVRGLLERIHGLSLANSGTFWHADGRVLPW